MVLVAIAGVWFALGRGFTSSNDGSHVALARALVLRHETGIAPDLGLTLGIDRARRDGVDLSDRPPGTAFAALPAVWLGAVLDEQLWARTTAQGALVRRPAARRFAQTYVARADELGVTTPLARYQGTALLIDLHAALMGLVGLAIVARWLGERGVDLRARLVAIVTLATATLWGPYSTALFSHVTSGTTWVAMAYALSHPKPSPTRLGLAGLAGCWAVASDYLLAVPVVLHVLLLVRPRAWIWVALGALPIAIATLAYHQAAFGSPLSIGYDHQVVFAFARARTTTFGGDAIGGVWTLLGFGHGAGLAAQSPIVFVAIAAWVRERPTWRQAAPILLWLAILCLHRTPEGGATEDHRYLVPVLPILAIGFASAWTRWIASGQRIARLRALAFAILATVSSALVWANFMAWRDG